VLLDGFVDSGVHDFLIVLDNVPYCFVKPSNRYFIGLGMGAAPDDPEEFATFIGVFIDHLKKRYSAPIVSSWRFRLGTEADGPRYGAPWSNETYEANDGHGGTIALRNGLQAYMAVYKAVAKVVKAKVPHAAFGPSNMAGINAGPGMSGGLKAYLLEFARFLRQEQLPIDFAAVSEYSRCDPHGNSPAKLMVEAIEGMRQFAAAAVDIPIPVEVHEFGWAHWQRCTDRVEQWTMGAYGASWGASAWLWLRRAGARRVFTWGLSAGDDLSLTYNFDFGISSIYVSGAATDRPLVSGWGWLMSAMVRMYGEEDGSADVTGNFAASTRSSNISSSEFVVEVPHTVQPAATAAAANVSQSIGCFRVANRLSRELHYLLVWSSANQSSDATVDWQLIVAPQDFPAGAPFWPLAKDTKDTVEVLVTRLDRSTAVHDLIKRRLVGAGLATGVGANDSHTVDPILYMTDDAGRQWLAKNATEYEQVSASALQPVELTASDVKFEDGRIAIRGTSGVSSMQLFTLRHKSARTKEKERI
jgi:hypothetical protein